MIKFRPLKHHKIDQKHEGGSVIHHFGLPHVNLPQRDNKQYYWVWGQGDGRNVVWGPFNTYEEAERKGSSKLSGYFEVIPLRTRQEQEASRIIRSKQLEKTGDAGKSFERFKHKE